ncbi:MAG TPA: hypothetical protein VMT23_03655 [Candidatus Binatia bacterium]|nr:hypothetical protein [Candidatus Binatia bacterium]
MKNIQKSFTLAKSLLVLIIIVTLCVVGYYLWHNNKTVSTYADCQKTAGSITEQSFPEVCITKDGKRFINPTQSPQ